MEYKGTKQLPFGDQFHVPNYSRSLGLGNMGFIKRAARAVRSVGRETRRVVQDPKKLALTAGLATGAYFLGSSVLAKGAGATAASVGSAAAKAIPPTLAAAGAIAGQVPAALSDPAFVDAATAYAEYDLARRGMQLQEREQELMQQELRTLQSQWAANAPNGFAPNPNAPPVVVNAQAERAGQIAGQNNVMMLAIGAAVVGAVILANRG